VISFQVEPYEVCIKEIDACLERHWHEIALDHVAVPLAKDEAGYQTLADAGALHIVTVRQDGILVGYIAGIVKAHLHYVTTLHAFTDVFWLRPDLRKGGIGIKLFREYERTLIRRGVIKVFIASKVHLDMSKIFERLGWTRTEVVYSKVIQDPLDPVVRQIDRELADWRI
jgi:GNAT superfamily N-acetyltransferase